MTNLPYGLPWWLWTLLNIGAVYRVTRLIVHDAFPPVARVRDAVLVRYDGRWPAYLITCEWCSSQWVAFIAVAGTAVLPEVWAPLAAALTLSAVTGWISEHH